MWEISANDTPCFLTAVTADYHDLFLCQWPQTFRFVLECYLEWHCLALVPGLRYSFISVCYTAGRLGPANVKPYPPAQTSDKRKWPRAIHGGQGMRAGNNRKIYFRYVENLIHGRGQWWLRFHGLGIKGRIVYPDPVWKWRNCLSGLFMEETGQDCVAGGWKGLFCEGGEPGIKVWFGMLWPARRNACFTKLTAVTYLN